MPHLRIEYSDNLGTLPQAQLLAALNAAVCASPEIAHEADLKTRLIPVAHYQIGTAQGARAFVHAELRLLSGRSTQAKQDLSERISAVLRQLTPTPAGTQVQWSVDIVDMERPCYGKGVL